MSKIVLANAIDGILVCRSNAYIEKMTSSLKKPVLLLTLFLRSHLSSAEVRTCKQIQDNFHCL